MWKTSLEKKFKIAEQRGYRVVAYNVFRLTPCFLEDDEMRCLYTGLSEKTESLKEKFGAEV